MAKNTLLKYKMDCHLKREHLILTNVTLTYFHWRWWFVSFITNTLEVTICVLANTMSTKTRAEETI